MRIVQEHLELCSFILALGRPFKRDGKCIVYDLGIIYGELEYHEL